MARSAGSLSVLPDVPSPVSILGRAWDDGAGPHGPRAGPGAAGRVGPHGVLHRWHVRQRKKGGSLIGKTKRGKGTKIMAIADGTGLPIAVSITSASPHEATPLEQTLAATLTTRAP